MEETPAVESPAEEAPVKKPARKRAPRPDALLAESVDTALEALREEFPDEQIGDHLGVAVDDERVMTHRFAGSKRGYRGWQWYATLARAPRAKKATVCELGLLPSEDSLLAPAWVPWADRVRPEDIRAAAEAAEAEGVKDDAAAQPGAEAPSEGEAPEAEASAADAQGTEAEQTDAGENESGDAHPEAPEHDEDDLTAAEIEASVAVKRRSRRRRYKARSRT